MDGTLVPFDEDYYWACVKSAAKVSKEHWSHKAIFAFHGNKNWIPEGILQEAFEHGLHSGHFISHSLKDQALLNQARGEMSLSYIKRNQDLREKLIHAKNIGITPLILTNSEPKIAEEALGRLGILDVIGDKKVFSFSVPVKEIDKFGYEETVRKFGNLSKSYFGEKGDFPSKGSVATYSNFLTLMKEMEVVPRDTTPRQIEFIDDRKSYVETAELAGWTAVLADEQEEPVLVTIEEMIEIKENFNNSINLSLLDPL